MTDPRFDPAFQRGYSGPAPRLVVRAAPARAVPAAPALPVSPAANSLAPLDPPVADPLAAADVEPAMANSDDLATDAVLERPRRNPFGLALLVGGALLLLLGVGMIWSAANTVLYYPGNGTVDAAQQAVSQLNYLLPPAFLLSGILGILGWLALGALRAAARVGD